MSYKARYDKGDWTSICDVCGRKFKASHLRKRWDGLMTCSEDWETRQPQDFVRGKADIQAPKWTRPEPENSYVFSCTPQSRASMADLGVAGCMTVGYIPVLECSVWGMTCFADIAVAGCAIANRLN